jgi:hypothetical protein
MSSTLAGGRMKCSQGNATNSKYPFSDYHEAMIQFICASAMCVQNYLGVGITSPSLGDSFVYRTTTNIYYCNRAAQLYKCIDKNEYEQRELR